MDLGRLVTFDWETSGELPEFSLQPWRISKGKMWGTSLAWVRHADGKALVKGGVLDDDTMPVAERYNRCKAMATEMLVEAIDCKFVLGGWFLTFDVGVLLGYGLGDLVTKVRFADGSCYGGISSLSQSTRRTGLRSAPTALRRSWLRTCRSLLAMTTKSTSIDRKSVV